MVLLATLSSLTCLIIFTIIYHFFTHSVSFDKITNWSQYNDSLRKRGMVSLYFPEGDLESLFINTQPYVEGESGRTTTYQVPYIQLIYTLYRLFDFGQRQITGYFE
ncbi:hypothetical protein [Rickettsia endosymbiont of Gonocerus acuteangulatus]|uniref:hypothetical protein n=1 Tax=Rickettsia endosymbiont of Gonocerus acuteangulatus TaxID=3066266 RepID=UPI00313348D7